MRKRKNMDALTAFIEGKAFAKVTSKQGFHKFMNEVQATAKGTVVDVPEAMIEDFGVNKLSGEYHLVYFVGGKAVHCADKEFFDYVFKTETPFIQKDDKILLFEV